MYEARLKLTSTKQKVRTFAEFIGLPGCIMKSAFNAVYPDQSKGKEVYLQAPARWTPSPTSTMSAT